jgi:hypothetical protein
VVVRTVDRFSRSLPRLGESPSAGKPANASAGGAAALINRFT